MMTHLEFKTTNGRRVIATPADLTLESQGNQFNIFTQDNKAHEVSGEEFARVAALLLPPPTKAKLAAEAEAEKAEDAHAHQK